MSHHHQTELDDLLVSAQQNLTDDCTEIARSHLQQALQLAEKHFGENSPEVDRVLKLKIDLHCKCQEDDQAQASFQDRIDRLRRKPSPPYETIITAHNDFAVFLTHHDRYDEAEGLLLQALKDCASLAPKNAASLAHTLYNLGQYYLSCNEYSQAIAHLEKSLQESERVRPYPLLKSARTTVELARCYHEAEIEPEKIISLLEPTLPFLRSAPNAPAEATSLGYQILGIVYYQQSRYRDACYALNQAAILCHQSRPRPYKRIASIYSWAADNEYAMGNITRALALAKKRLEFCSREYPEHSPETNAAKVQLTNIYLPQERYLEAEPLLEQVIESIKELNGPDDPNLLRHYNNLSYTYIHTERFPMAETLLTLAREIILKNDPTTPCPFNTKNFGLLYQKMGHNLKAIAEYRKAREHFVTQFSEDHPMVSFIDKALRECSAK